MNGDEVGNTYAEMIQQWPLFGVIFVTLFTSFGFMVIMNIFLLIIQDAFVFQKGVAKFSWLDALEKG